jgi:hypothetical protein
MGPAKAVVGLFVLLFFAGRCQGQPRGRYEVTVKNELAYTVSVRSTLKYRLRTYTWNVVIPSNEEETDPKYYRGWRWFEVRHRRTGRIVGRRRIKVDSNMTITLETAYPRGVVFDVERHNDDDDD